MNVEYMRSQISKVYDGPRWKARVNLMPDNQVIAIYYSFLRTGKFDKKEVKKLMSKPEEIQISIWDILKENTNAGH